MSQRNLEQRIASLEETVAELVAVVGPLRQNRDWRSTVGMFEGDPVMDKIQEEGQRLREANRREAQRDVRRDPP